MYSTKVIKAPSRFGLAADVKAKLARIVLVKVQETKLTTGVIRRKVQGAK